MFFDKTPLNHQRGARCPTDLSEAGNEHTVKEEEKPINRDDIARQSPRERNSHKTG